MIQKIIVGVLFITVIGATGVGVYDALQPAAPSEALIAPETVTQDVAEESETQPEVVEVIQDDTASDNEAVIIPTAQAAPIQVQQQENTQTTETVQIMNMVGESWTSTGTVVGMDDTGLTLAQDDGTEIYIELGPPTYWREQGITISEGDTIIVDGFSGEAGIHAAMVTTNGEQLAVRTADGQPLWSGGATNENGQQGSEHSDEPKVAPDEWVTLTATISSMSQGNMTALIEDGMSLQIQLGQPSFWQSQGITFNAGDAIEVLGFWEGATFRSGEIRIPATGQRLMLLDPNGRPLWAGPGRTNEGQTSPGNQNASYGTTTDHTRQNNSNGQGSQSNGNQGSNGKGGNGNSNQNQATGVPATEWETINGHVVDVEPLSITIQTADGTQITVGLGEFDFWTEMDYWFVIPELVTIDGYWQGTQFEAGQLTFEDGTGTLIVRDNNGDLVWSNNTSDNGGNGNGNQYRGGRS